MESEQLKKILPLFLLLLLISLFLFLFDNFGWLAGVKEIVQKPFLVLEKPIFSVYQSTNASIKRLTDRTENERLVETQTQLRHLAVDQNKLSTCLEENEHLKKLLGAPLPSEWKFKMARVIGIAEKMKIDMGLRNGAEEGMIVVSENIYIGQVISLGKGESLVRLATDSNSRIPVVIKPSNTMGTQARGLLRGQFGDKLLLERVLQEEDIRQGDLVITSGEEGYLPDLIIGQIKEVSKGTAEIYQQAVITPLVDYSSLKFVFLVMP
jgi:rod shape-determining protein MreC